MIILYRLVSSKANHTIISPFSSSLVIILIHKIICKSTIQYL